MTLWQRLAEHAAAQPDKIAVTAPDATLSYAGLADISATAARVLSEQGVERGDRVAYLGLNSAALLVLVFAASRGGFMLSPLNWRLAPDELRWIIENADPAVMVADDLHSDIAREIAGVRPILDAARFSGGSRPPGPRHRQNAPAPDVGAEDPLLLVYTSGATGRPKGAVLTQTAVIANAALSIDMHDLTAEDHVLTALPMFHVGGLNIQTLPALLSGATVTLMDRFEPGACLSLIETARPTLTVQVPATLQAMMADRAWEATDLSSLRVIATGSTDVPVPLIEVVHARGIPVIQIYGATETGPVVVYQKRQDAMSRTGSIGRAGPGVDVQITRPDGMPTPEDETGEIWLRSPTLARGYWRNPEADAAFDGGWFRTGDMARLDSDGFLWFADRLKNVIISGGENIYPAELERVLSTVPGVREGAVTGRPDARWGMVPVAVVVGDVTREAVLAAFEGHLARFKHPKDVVFIDVLPRNAMGKVDLTELRSRVAGTPHST